MDTRMRRFFCLLVLTAALAGATEAPTPDRFAITLAGLTLGTLDLSAREDASRYTATARFETAGLAGLLDYAFEGQADGNLAAGALPEPSTFVATTRSPRALRHTRIAWRDGIPASVVVDPPRDVGVTAAEQIGAVDPVSALALLFRGGSADRICASSVLVFDGSRSLRLTLGPPVRAGDELSCAGDYARLGGEAFTPVDPPETPFEIVYSVAGDHARFARLRIPTRFGDALIARED